MGREKRNRSPGARRERGTGGAQGLVKRVLMPSARRSHVEMTTSWRPGPDTYDRALYLPPSPSPCPHKTYSRWKNLGRAAAPISPLSFSSPLTSFSTCADPEVRLHPCEPWRPARRRAILDLDLDLDLEISRSVGIASGNRPR